MKKVLLVVALLLLATPLFAADVTITATKVGAPVGTLQKVNIGYTGAAVSPSPAAISAFALSLSVDLTADANIQNIRDFNVGESNGAAVPPGKSGYGIFPAKFRTYIQVQNSTTADWADTNYTPLAEWGDSNAGWGNNTKWIVAELGTLYQGDANAPASSGTLFAIDVNVLSGDCNLCIALEQIRGGVVRKDANAATVTLPPGGSGAPASCIKVGASGVTVPNVLTMNRVAARTAITTLGLGVVEVNVPPTAINQLRTIIAQNPAGGTSVPPGSVVTINAVSYPVKDSAPASLYANWVTSGRPACWGYARQCRGDADGKAAFGVWVSNADLNILRPALTKATSLIPPGGRCADFDHKAAFGVWVSNADLNILRAYLTKAASLVPLCGSAGPADANYWYYCVPTGGTCPGGVCAPANICPNTP